MKRVNNEFVRLVIIWASWLAMLGKRLSSGRWRQGPCFYAVRLNVTIAEIIQISHILRSLCLFVCLPFCFGCSHRDPHDLQDLALIPKISSYCSPLPHYPHLLRSRSGVPSTGRLAAHLLSEWTTRRPRLLLDLALTHPHSHRPTQSRRLGPIRKYLHWGWMARKC